MKLRKCPRCELNYIMNDTDEYCKVCLREMKGEESKEEIELCTVCNEAPAIPGKDMCLFCLKELGQRKGEQDDVVQEDDLEAEVVEDDEILPEIEEEIPEDAYEEISNDLSLEEMEEEEDKESDEDQDEF